MTSLKRNDPATPKHFQLQTGDVGDVSSRISSVFDSLNGLEAKHQAWERSLKEDASGTEESLLKEDPDISNDFGARTSSAILDGVFKRPWAAPAGPCKRPRFLGARSDVSGRRLGSVASTTPDYKVHPERWTCYSLDSVSEDDMSEASNKAAALDYLRERQVLREQSRRQDRGDSGEDGLAMRHVFQKRLSDGDADMEDVSSELSHRAGSGKLVMPECVVGVKPATGKKAREGTRQRSTSLPAGQSSSLISFDCAENDDRDELDFDDEETDKAVSQASERGPFVKKAKARALRARGQDDD
uniref:U5 small nuclear ribonucleoprotein TSSC4 n=1 Tax=Amblyomma triste TaxID=251400 RepID=A0A023G8A0_AMBTT